MKMKTVVLAVAGSFVFTAAVQAAPYFVGENLKPVNNITLGFMDTPTKKSGATERGNIAAFDLKGDYYLMDGLAANLGLPFFYGSRNAVGGDTKTGIGNVGLGMNWNNRLSALSDDTQFGYSAMLDFYAPTSRTDEANFVSRANPTTEVYSFLPRATTISPTVGVYVEGTQFLIKGNAGIGYSYIQKDGGAPTDQNWISVKGQVGATWKATEDIAANLEYNLIAMEGAMRTALAVGTEDTQIRHALAPSVSANFDGIRGQAFASVPFDQATRDVHNVAFGLNVGYTF